MMTHSPRVAIIGAFDPSYPRHQILIAGLERLDIQVMQCPLSRTANTIRQIPAILAQRAALRRCDAVLVPAFNQLLAPIIGAIARHGRVIVDYMVGLTESLVEERGLTATRRKAFYAAVDRYNLRHFLTLTDTYTHQIFFEQFAGQQLSKMTVVPVGVYNKWYDRRPLPMTQPDQPLLVQFFGSYIPFHGVDVIVDAAAQLSSDPRFHFELIGRGQTYSAIRASAEAHGLANLTFVDPIPAEALPERVAHADICLGVFGPRDKTEYVIPNKVYQCLAIGRPLITAESTALNECFTPGRDLVTIPPGDPTALASALRHLAEFPDERARLSAAASEQITQRFQPEHVVLPLYKLINALVDQD